MTQHNRTEHNGKQEIRKHYDVMSPYYRELWGEHIHHGYWIQGDETKEQAQIQLIERLAHEAGMRRGCKVLDVGCGIGGSSIYLAKHWGGDVTGITISPMQVEMAERAAAREGVRARFILMDAEAMRFEELFDVIWSVESISHYRDTGKFFAAAAKLLKPGGVLAMTDWFKKEGLQASGERRFITPIESSMLVELHTTSDYQEQMEEAGLRVTAREILNKCCERTWDISLEIIKDKKLWEIAAKHGAAFVDFLRGFRAMRAGFRSGNLVYGLLIAKQSWPPD
jgi:tocopherol O-methyltransferase